MSPTGVKKEPSLSIPKGIHSKKSAPVWLALGLTLSILLVYAQVAHFSFINFDDGAYVSENPFVQKGLTPDSIRWAFSSVYSANWHPVTWLSHMTDVELFGMNAGRHHLVNVFFHIVNSILLFVFLKRTTRSTVKSVLVAALFALHPLHVESVAWVAERKDVLSTSFGLMALLAYARYVDRPSVRRYVGVAILLALGLMSKPMLVTFPFLLLLLDIWPLCRFQGDVDGGGFRSWTGKKGRELLREKVPLLILVALSSVVTVVAQSAGGAVAPVDKLTMGARIANGIVAYCWYIVKTLVPAGLAVFYPYPDTIPAWQPVSAALCIGALTWAAFRLRRNFPYVFTGWFWFLGSLAPVIGLVQVGAQAMADRYTYIPLTGLFILAVWGAGDIASRLRFPKIAVAGAIALVGIYGFMSWRQLTHWKNSIALFEHDLAVAEPNVVACNNLGDALFHEGRAEAALPYYRQALAIEPLSPEPYVNMGNALMALNRDGEAIDMFTRALAIAPDSREARNNLGLVLERNNRREEAIEQYRKVLEKNPDFAEAHHNLGVALFREGKTEEALIHLRRAVDLKPDYTVARENLNKVLQILRGNRLNK
jgi:Flp pilus assembly protein TadD